MQQIAIFIKLIVVRKNTDYSDLNLTFHCVARRFNGSLCCALVQWLVGLRVREKIE